MYNVSITDSLSHFQTNQSCNKKGEITRHKLWHMSDRSMKELSLANLYGLRMNSLQGAIVLCCYNKKNRLD